MRKLNGHDVFMAAKLCKSLGVQDEMKRIAQTVADGRTINPQELGIELIFGVIGNGGDAEKDFWSFASGPLEVSAIDLAEMGIDELAELLTKYKDEFVNEETLRGFFGWLRKMMK